MPQTSVSITSNGQKVARVTFDGAQDLALETNVGEQACKEALAEAMRRMGNPTGHGERARRDIELLAQDRAPLKSYAEALVKLTMDVFDGFPGTPNPTVELDGWSPSADTAS